MVASNGRKLVSRQNLKMAKSQLKHSKTLFTLFNLQNKNV